MKQVCASWSMSAKVHMEVLHSWGKYAAHWWNRVILITITIIYVIVGQRQTLTCDSKYSHYLMDCMVLYKNAFFGSYEYFMFIKVKLKFHCFVSMLHYNSISDIRTQENMNKFDISDIPSKYPFPTTLLVLPILCS